VLQLQKTWSKKKKKNRENSPSDTKVSEGGGGAPGARQVILLQAMEKTMGSRSFP